MMENCPGRIRKLEQRIADLEAQRDHYRNYLQSLARSHGDVIYSGSLSLRQWIEAVIACSDANDMARRGGETP